MLVKEFFNKNEVESFQTFMQNYDNIEYQKSFVSWSGMKRPRYVEGLVSAYDLLNELANASVEVVNDFNDFMKEYGSLEVVSEKGDNTYNYNGHLDHYLNFNVLELESDQVMVSLAVGTGLDPRYGYTRNIIMIFDNEYNFMDALSTNFELFSCEARANGKLYEVGFDASATSECGLLSIFESETGEQIFYDEALVDVGDLEDMQSTVSKVLEAKVTIENPCYFWYAC